MLAYENKRMPLLSRTAFRRRLAIHGGFVFIVIVVSLGIGVVGYHGLAKLPWLDALLNASMILGGMGPVNPMVSAPAKLFASVYALYSGLILLVSVGILLAPLFHRFLHRFHLESESGR